MLKLLDELFEPENVEIDANVRVEDLARERCGRVDNDWIASLRKLNPSTTGSVTSKAAVLTLPPLSVLEGSGSRFSLKSADAES
jgi:hypothetical protein